MKIKVTRSFFLAGELLSLDAETEVDDRFGRELIHNGKAAELKPEVDPELKPEVDPELKPEVDPELKPEVDPELKQAKSSSRSKSA